MPWRADRHRYRRKRSVARRSNLGAAINGAVSVYLTGATGIGGGLLVDGRPLHGLLHPEMGHVRVLRVLGNDVRS